MKKIALSIMMCIVLTLTGCAKYTTINTNTSLPTTEYNDPSIDKNITEDITNEEDEIVITPNDESNNNGINENPYLVQSNVPAIVVPEDTTYFGYEYNHGSEFNGDELYEFDDDLTRGSVSLKNLYSRSIDTLDYEAYYGISAYVENDDVYVIAYNHSSEHKILSANIVSDMGDKKPLDINYENYIVINGDDLDYGLYNIIVEFDTNVVDLYIFVAENGVYTCKNTEHLSTYQHLYNVIERKTTVNNLFELYGIEPEDCLSIDDIYYPCLNENGGRCDTQRWAELSHDLLIENSQWSDEFKLFVYVEWFNNNIAYDYWRANNGPSRAKYYNVWDGTYSMWNTKIGVCCDFTNALIIMLREQGIPATSLENDGHMWLGVYIDGQWREVDLTTILQYSTYELHNYSRDDFECSWKDYTDYGTYGCDELFYIGEDVWTYDRIINGRIIDIDVP